MGKRNNLEHEAIMALKSFDRIGQSKYDAKLKAKEDAKAAGETFKNVKGFYSYNTYKDYLKKTRTFINYCMDNHNKEFKHFSECRKYVEEFLSYCEQDKGVSAWTLNGYAHAICRSLKIDVADLNYTRPKRLRKDIKRCRDDESSKYRDMDERFSDLKKFVRATGCRRAELLALNKKDIKFSNDGKVIFLFLQGKGGTERWAPVNPECNDLVLDFFNRKTYMKNGKEKLFRESDLPKGSIHDLRADYAMDMYKLYESGGKVSSGHMYHCRGDMKGISFDKGILKAVSENMGHHRCDVVVSNYLSSFYR